ncbi:putative ferric reduction oxidase 1 [Colletotrichum siamense]|nr:putative ferric reduction oxidase 1 [Colletotrichum siamense]
MTKSTARTARVILLIVLLIIFGGAATGLTFAPCYATLCPEDFFAFESRIHIAIFYGMLGVVSLLLLLGSSFRAVERCGNLTLISSLPLIHKRLTLGGLIVVIWIACVTMATTAMWLSAHWQYWGERTDPLNWMSAKIALTVTGVTGHYADILLGLSIVPVSRNSLLGHAFGVHQSILLYAHKLATYMCTLAVLAHGVGYGIFALDPSKDEDEAKLQLFSNGNPTMTELESQKRSAWYGTVTYTGVGTFVCMLMIVATALPRIRRLHYNTFYNAHIVCSVATFVGASIHASSDFYLLLPGLSLWVADWVWRLFRGEGGSLRKQVAVLENAGSGWYRVSLGARVKFELDSASEAESSAPAAGWPLSLYYLSIPSVSRLQSHAFTAAVSSTSQSGPVFLFRRSEGKKSQKALEKEWTWAVGSLVSSVGLKRQLDVRVEGPYQPTDTGFESASHIICIVGGTGITGAHSLALWWLKARSTAGDTKFSLVWTIRERESVHVQEWFDLVKAAESQTNMTVSAHVSAEVGRLDPQEFIHQSLGLGMATDGREKGTVSTGTAWVYSSGPGGLLQATQKACQATDKDIRRLVRDQAPVSVKGISWYIAKWEV